MSVAAAWRIVPLAEHPAAIPLLAAWFSAEWQLPEPRPPAYFAAQLGANLQRDALPITFIALRGEEVVGTISLDHTDLPSHDHRFSPWLASLYVVAAERRAGVASALIAHLLAFARALELPRLYLWTGATSAFYEKRGWRRIENTTCGGHEIQIMEWSF